MKKTFLIQSVIFAIVFHSLPASPIEEKHCNLDLMNSFRLEGHPEPQRGKPIDICKNVRDNCCTLFDQMLILKLWKDYSSPVLAYRVNKIIGMYRSIFSFHHYFYGLRIEAVPTHMFRESGLRYIKTGCTTSYSFRNDVVESDLVKVRKSKKKGGKLARELSDSVNSDEKGIASVNFIQVPEDYKERIDVPIEVAPRDLKDDQNSVSIPEKELEGLRRIQTIKNRFHKTIHKAMSKVGNIVTRKLNNILNMREKLQKRLNLVNHQLVLSKTDPRVLADPAGGHGAHRAHGTHGHAKKEDDELFNLRRFDDLYGKRPLEKNLKTYLEEERQSLQETIKTLDKNAKKILKYQNKDLMDHFIIDFDKYKLAKFIENVYKLHLPKVPEKEQYIRTRQEPPSLSFNLPKTACGKFTNTMYRRFYFINQHKFRYCDNVLWAVKKIHLEDFLGYIPDIQQTLLQFGSLRRGLYCSICEYSTQKYIDFPNRAIFYNMDFCESYILQYAEYFRWKDILFAEYLNFIFQTMECYDTPGSVLVFPFNTFVDRQFRRSFFFRRCFDVLNNGGDWFKFCHFICKEFKYDAFSQLIEGDMTFLREIISRMLSFFRKKNIEIKKLDLSRLKSVTKVDMLKDHHNPVVHEDIESMIKKEFEDDLRRQRPRVRAPSVNNSNNQKESDNESESPNDNQQGNADAGRILETSLSEKVEKSDNTKSPKSDYLGQIFERKLKVIETQQQSLNEGPIERRLAPSDFTPDPIYNVRINIGQINNLTPFFFNDTRGINPIQINTLVDFDVDVDVYLKTSAVKSSAEMLSADVLKKILLSIQNENGFNEMIFSSFPTGDGHFKSLEIVDELHAGSASVVHDSHSTENKEQNSGMSVINRKTFGKDLQDDYAQEGMPELSYMLS